MAGQGERFDPLNPKQFYSLASKPIYLWTLEKFSKSRLFQDLILVCPKDLVAKVQAEVGSSYLVVAGGVTRQESSYLGLKACGKATEIVVIHDAVRPFVSERILKENIEGARKFGAVDTCIPSSDTLVYSKDGKIISGIPNRSEYLRGQTPQSFSYPLILEAHERATTVATDDCRLALDQGHAVHIVKGEEENLKITTPTDLLVAEAILKQK